VKRPLPPTRALADAAMAEGETEKDASYLTQSLRLSVQVLAEHLSEFLG
jgi:hypothetical protein